MKANKVPKKLYIENRKILYSCLTAYTNKRYDDDIEYTRTNAFIKKAIGWIDYNNRNGGCNFDGWEKDFKKYMKGE